MTFPITKTADHTTSVGNLVSATVGGEYVFPTYLVTSDGTALSTSNPLHVTPGTGATWAVSAASLPLPSGAATAANQSTGNGHLATIAGAVSGSEMQVDVLTMPTVTISDGGGSVTVDGSVTVIGTVTANIGTVGTLAVESGGNLAAAATSLATLAGAVSGTEVQVDVLTLPTVTVSDGGGSLTVDGTVSVSGSVAVTGTFWQSTQPVSIASAVPVTDNSGSLTVDAPVDTPVFVRLSDGATAISTLPVSLASVPSHDVTNAGTFAVQVDGTALTRLTDIETNTDSGAVVGNGTAATAQRVTLASDSTGQVVLAAGTAAIGKLVANSGVTIGAVEIAAAQTLATVTTVGTVTTCSTVTTLTGGGVAHDGADSGNPVKVGWKASATPSTGTPVASGDRTDAIADLDGAALVRPFTLGDLVSERVTDTGGSSTAFSNFGATASTRNYVTGIVVYNSSASAGYVDFRDGTGGSVLFTVPLPAGGGAVVTLGGAPLFRTTANTALAYDVSAALSTVYISVSGYKSKV